MPTPLRLHPLALAAALAASAPLALALPEGAQLRFGQAQVQTPPLGGSAPQLAIHQTSQRAALDWTSFSIAAGERVVISQPGRDAVLLNRVTGSEPSQIFGSLQSNGTVWLLNPRGIVFGRSSQVDVGGLLASTLAIRGDDMAAGRLLLGRGPGAVGSIQADGRISAPDGSVVLVAPSLVQGGLISARRIGLAAATEVQVDVDGDGLVFFNARNDGSLPARLAQLGTLRADGGTAELRAAGRAGFADTVLNLEGVVQARSIGRRDGRIVIDGGDSGITRVAGTVDARGEAAGEQGGQITVLGEKIGLTGSALLDASGMAGGGGLRVGGDLRGAQADRYRPAQQLVVQRGARLQADALARGDGGLVVLWAQQSTRFAGAADARGGPLGGDGGLVEVSGQGFLDFAGTSDRSAPHGRAGLLLLDPLNLEIGAVADLNGDATTGDNLAGFSLLFGDQATKSSRITAGVVATQLGNGDVRLEATNNITVSSPITVVLQSGPPQQTPHTLTLRAGNDVLVGSAVSNAGSVVLSAATSDAPSGTVGTANGKVVVTANITSQSGGITLTNNGSSGVHQLQGTLSASTLTVTGNISIPAAQTLTLNLGSDTTLAAQLSGDGALAKAGAQVLTLSAGNSFTGGTTVSGGTLAIRGLTASAGSGAINLGGNTLDIADGASVANPVLVADGARIASSSGGGTLALGDGAGVNLATGASTLRLSGSATQALVVARPLNDHATGQQSVEVQSGLVRLAVANTHDGGTSVRGNATLDIGADTALGSGTLTLGGTNAALDRGTLAPGAGFSTSRAVVLGAGGGAVDVASGVATLAGQISGSGALAVGGAGTLVLGAANSHGGGTSVSGGGTLSIDAADRLGSGNLVLDGGTLLASASFSTGTPVALGAGGGTLGVGNGLVLGLDGVVSGAGNTLAKTGAGRLVLTAANTHGSTTVDGGTLALDGGTAGSGAIAVGANRLELANGSSVANAVTVGSGTLVNITGSGNSSAAAELAGSVTLGGNASLQSTGAGLRLTGAIGEDATPRALAVTAGTVTLAGTVANGNTYSGGTSIGSATLVLDTAAANAGTAASTLTVGVGGRLDINNGASVANPVVVANAPNGATIGNTAGSGTLAAGAAVALGAGTGLTLASTGGGLAVQRAISAQPADAATAALTVTGSGGAVTLSAANSHGGGTTVSGGGRLVIGADDRLGSGSLTLDGGTLQTTAAFTAARPVVLGAGGGTLQLAGSALTLNSPISGSGALTQAGGTLVLGAANSHAGGTTVNGGGTLSITAANQLGGGNLALDNGTLLTAGSITTTQALALGAGGGTLQVAGGTLTLNGTVSGSSGTLGVAGGGTLVLGAANSHGGTTVGGGSTLSIGAANRLGSGTLVLDDGTLLASASFDTATAVALGAGGGTLGVGGGVVLGLDGVVSGAGHSLTKTGAGRLVLSAANTHGSTTVDGGTLALSGGTAGTGTLALGANRLEVSNGTTVANAVAVAGGTIANIPNPANAGGAALLAGNLALSGNLTLHSSGAGLTLSGLVTEDATPRAVAVTAGTVTLANTVANGNTYSGGTSVGAATLVLATANANAGDAAATIAVGATGRLDINNGASVANPVAVASGAVIGNTAGSGTLAAAAGRELALAPNAVATLASSSSGPGNGLTVARPVTDSGGTGRISIAGPGRVVFSAAAPSPNSFGGGTTVGSGGTLVLSDASQLGAGNLVLDNGTLQTTAAITTAKTVALGAGGGTLQVGGGTLALNGTVSGSGALMQAGGTLVLGAANSHAGGTTVGGGGTLSISAASQLGAGNLALDNGTLLANTSFSTTKALALGAGGGTLNVPANQALTLGGAVSGAGRSLTKAGAGRLVLTADNGHGGTTVAGGTLAISGATADAGSGTINLGSNRLEIADGSTVANAVAVAGGTIANTPASVPGPGAPTPGRLTGDVVLGGSLGLSSSGAGLAVSGAIGQDGTPRAVSVDSGTVTLANTSPSSYSGGTTLAGASKLVLSGAAANAGTGSIGVGGGRLELASVAGLPNAVSINGGSITSTAGSSTLAGPLTLAGNAMLAGGTGGLTLAGAIGGGSPATTLATSGTVVFSADNSVQGSTVVGSGTLALSGPGADAGSSSITLGSATLDLRQGATPGNAVSVAGGRITNSAGTGRLNGTLQLLGPVTLSSTGSGLVLANTISQGAGAQAIGISGGSVALTSANTHSGGTTVLAGGTLVLGDVAALGGGGLLLDGGTLQLAAALDTSRPVSLGSAGGTLDTGSFNVALRGAISGPGAFTKQGSGTLTLFADNSQTGTTSVAGGVLAVSGQGADAGNGRIDIGSQVLDLVNGATITNAVTVGAGGSLRNSAGAGTLAAAGSLQLQGDARLEVTGSGTGLTLRGSIGEDGAARALTIATTAGSAVTLANHNTYTGGTAVPSGTLRIDALAVAAADAGSGPISVGGGVLDLRNGAMLANAVALAGGTLHNSSGSGTLTGPLGLSGAGGQLASSGSGLLVAGAVSGSGGLQVQAGSVSLSHVGNSFGGGTTVHGGSLQLLGGDALPDAGLLTLAGSGRLVLAATETIGALQGSAGTSVDLAGFTLTTGTGSSSFAGSIGGTGHLVKAGAGSFTLAGANTYTGSTTVADGVLALGGVAAAGRLHADSTLVVAGGTLDLGGRSEAVAAVQLAGGAIVNGKLASASTIDLRAGSASAVLAGTSASVGLDKTTTGTVVLTGANTTRGTTTVGGGTLQLAAADNRLDPAAPLVVQGGTLDLGGRSHQVAAVQLDGGEIRNGSLASASSHDLRAGTVSAQLGGTADAVGLDKTGPGTLTLRGTNTYRGATSVQGGTLVLDGAANVLPDAGTLRVQGGTVDIGSHSETVAALDLQSGSLLGTSGVLTATAAIGLHSGQVGAILGGTQGVTKQGSGTVTLTGASQATGTTLVSQGTLVLDGAQRLAEGSALDVAPGGTVTLDGHQVLQSLNLAGRLSGSGSLAVARADLDGGSLAVPLTAGLLASNGHSSADAALQVGTLSVRSGTLALGAAQLVSDTAQVDVARDATLRLGGPDTVRSLALRGTLAGTGPFTAAQYALDGGTVQVPLGGGALVSDGSSRLEASAAVASVEVRSGTFTTAEAGRFGERPVVTVANPGRWVLDGPQRIGRLTGEGTVDLQAHTLQTGSGGDSRFDGAIGGSGSLVKQGASTFTLRGATSYSGDTVVEAGTLALAGAQRLADSTAVRVDAGATLALDSANTVRQLQLSGTLGGAGTLTADTVQLQGGRADAALGAGALVSDGASTLAGPAAVTSLVVQGGSLTLAAANLLSAAPATQVGSGGSLVLGGDTTLGSLAGTGHVKLGSAALRTGSRGSSRFDGLIAGSGGLVKQGDGSFTLGSTQAYQGPTTVQAGTLVLDGTDRLASASAVVVDPGATLRLAGHATVASLQLAGTLDGAGTLTAASMALDGGTALADLGAGRLTSRGNSRLDGTAAAGTVQVQQGQLTLGAADRLAAGAAVVVDPGARLTLGGGEQVASLQLAGTLDGSGRLRAASLALQGGTADADLGGGALTASGVSRLNGQATVDTLRVDGGSLVLGSAGRLQGLPAVTLAGGATLALGGDDSMGSLAGSGTLDLGRFTLATGAGASSSFAGVLAGSGGLVKRGADTGFTLTGTSTYTGPTWVAEGTLTLGDGRTAGALAGTSAFRTDGTLRFDRADAVLLAQPVAGSGALEQAGSGTLTLAGSNKTHSGATTVNRGTLATVGDEVLSDASAVQVGPAGQLLLGGADTVGALSADGPVGLRGRLTAGGALDLRGPVSATDGGALLLQAASITAEHPGNQWGSRLSLHSTGAVNLAAGSVAGVQQSLTLGELQLGGGGRIQAASVLLDGATTLAGGTLVLDLTRGEVLVEPGGALLGRLTPANRQLAFTDDLLRQRAATPADPVALTVADGAQLDVRAVNGGSVALLNPDNRVDGGLSVVLGPAGQPWKPNLAQGGGGLQYSLQNRLRLAGSQLQIGGVGLQADVVGIEADGLATRGQAAIVAKLPFDNQAGTATSLPALTLVLREQAFADTGGGATSSSFGSGSAPLRIDVGSVAFGNRSDPLTSGGYVSVLPPVRLGGVGRTAVFLQGPPAAAGYSFFYDGARRQGAVPVFYNGESATPPQVSGSIASTVAVSEGARKERFDEAVRTENVALRLRAGVIAEVGPGTPATVNTMPMDRMRPPACSPAPGTLACP